MTVPTPRGSTNDTTPAQRRPDGCPPAPPPWLPPSAPPSTSQPAVPARLNSSSSIAAQGLALIDRTLADEDRTRRAHSFVDPMLLVVAVAAVVLVVVVSLCVAGGIGCLVLGLHGAGPVGGKLLVAIGAGQLGLGALAGAGGATLRRWVVRWLRARS